MSMRLAAGTFGRPGMVMILLVWQTMKPAPVQTRTSLTVTVKPLGAPRRAGLSDRDYWVFATQIGMWSRPKASSS